MMKRKPEEIVKKIREIREADFFGFRTSDLVVYLPYKLAKEFLAKDTKKVDWEKQVAKKSPAELIKDYLPFAWDKANDCRGLSASRSIDHMRAWLWLDGSSIPDHWLEDYSYYGKPQLVLISELYGFPWKEHDSGDWHRSELDTISSAEKKKAVQEALKMKKILA